MSKPDNDIRNVKFCLDSTAGRNQRIRELLFRKTTEKAGSVSWTVVTMSVCHRAPRETVPSARITLADMTLADDESRHNVKGARRGMSQQRAVFASFALFAAQQERHKVLLKRQAQRPHSVAAEGATGADTGRAQTGMPAGASSYSHVNQYATCGTSQASNTYSFELVRR
ncbi:hypothetical protein BDV95DRAFT_668583 [Massariosphaeria phaeospora]|uniref:Uncharacterized protein n=1 Tax=Massariosphaeria phaeospora TaxID=100035 RepID=A0A7C8MEB9_9PLEO|nr:hypothetical protein BDV95DRAFT_668583 [Massariosphaeria phaeospora]